MWGPELWKEIHNYAKNWNGNKYEAMQYYRSIPKKIPCQECRKNWMHHIQICPIRMENKKELYKWTVDMHNLVNIELGKPIYHENNKMIILIVLILICLVFANIFLFR